MICAAVRSAHPAVHVPFYGLLCIKTTERGFAAWRRRGKTARSLSAAYPTKGRSAPRLLEVFICAWGSGVRYSSFSHGHLADFVALRCGMKKPPATTAGGEFSLLDLRTLDPRRDTARSAEMGQGTGHSRAADWKYSFARGGCAVAKGTGKSTGFNGARAHRHLTGFVSDFLVLVYNRRDRLAEQKAPYLPVCSALQT